MKHKSHYYKLSVVNYYLNHDFDYDNTCKILAIIKQHKYKECYSYLVVNNKQKVIRI